MELSKLTLEIFSKLEQKWLSDFEKPTPKTKILSIDGGGLKSLIAGEVLVHLEEQIKAKTNDPDAKIADFFDVITGSGIGGIFAAMLTADDGSGRPLYTAKDAVKFVREKQSEMFKRPVGQFLRRRRMYSGKTLEKVLKEALGLRTLKETCKPLLIPCYDLNTSGALVFSQADAYESPSFDFELWKVCRATSATPALFKPFRLKSVDGKTCCLAIDGGLVMNNPAAAAVTHVLHNKRDFPAVNGVEDLMVLSLGSGPCVRQHGGRRSVDGIGTESVVEIALDGVSETVDQLLGNAFCWNRESYLRVQPNGLPSESKGSMEGVVGGESKLEEEVRDKACLRMLEEKGMETLPFGGKRLLAESNGQLMEKFVQCLVASRKLLPPSPSKQTRS